MIEGDFDEMKPNSVSNIIQLGGTILRSARSKDFQTPEGRRKAYENLRSHNIDGIVAIGGDGTFTGANVFMKEYPEIAIMGCPGTIDNDLFGTDYTIGYDTAINTAMNAIDNIKDTANAHDRLFFVEVMGRDAGFIAMRAGIATGAEAVLIPESPTDIENLIKTLDSNHKNKKNACIVVVAEGDDAGGALKIAQIVGQKFKEYEIKVSILGHIQRGGRPTCMERVRASRMGIAAVKALLKGDKGHMIGIINEHIVQTPFEMACKTHPPMDGEMQEVARILS
jgi:6-phosphofructokinase 1